MTALSAKKIQAKPTKQLLGVLLKIFNELPLLIYIDLPSMGIVSWNTDT